MFGASKICDLVQSLNLSDHSSLVKWAAMSTCSVYLLGCLQTAKWRPDGQCWPDNKLA